MGYMANRRSTSKKASKKKSTRSKKARAKEVAPEHELPGGFWRQVVAVLMLVLAVVFIFNWLGDGGPVLQAVNDAIYRGIGYAEFLIPVLLVWLAVKIFRSEDNRLPVVMWVASILMIVWVAGIAGVPTHGVNVPTGGVVGEWLNDMMLQLGHAAAVLIYVVLMFVTVMFILQTNPVTVFRAIGRMFKTGEKEDKKNAKLMKKAAGEHTESDGEFKVNAGVAVDATPVAEKASKLRGGSWGAKIK